MPTPSEKNTLLAGLLRDATMEIRDEGRNLKSKKFEYLADLILTIPLALIEDRFDSSRLIKQALRFRTRFGENSSHDYALKARQIRAVDARSRQNRG